MKSKAVECFDVLDAKQEGLDIKVQLVDKRWYLLQGNFIKSQTNNRACIKELTPLAANQITFILEMANTSGVLNTRFTLF